MNQEHNFLTLIEKDKSCCEMWREERTSEGKEGRVFLDKG